VGKLPATTSRPTCKTLKITPSELRPRVVVALLKDRLCTAFLYTSKMVINPIIGRNSIYPYRGVHDEPHFVYRRYVDTDFMDGS
jgi:hypothetical protein